MGKFKSIMYSSLAATLIARSVSDHGLQHRISMVTGSIEVNRGGYRRSLLQGYE